MYQQRETTYNRLFIFPLVGYSCINSLLVNLFGQSNRSWCYYTYCLTKLPFSYVVVSCLFISGPNRINLKYWYDFWEYLDGWIGCGNWAAFEIRATENWSSWLRIWAHVAGWDCLIVWLSWLRFCWPWPWNVIVMLDLD